MSVIIETPWAIICPEHGLTFLTSEQYIEQMYHPDEFWKCPICGKFSEWTDENFEKYEFDNEGQE